MSIIRNVPDVNGKEFPDEMEHVCNRFLRVTMITIS